jgi:hypothetical protein
MQSSSAVLSRCRTALSLFVLALGPMLYAQTPASCTFTIFQLDTSANNTSTSIGGINDFRTLVGSRFLGGGNVRGLIRFSGGGISYFNAPNGGDTRLTGRNNSGISTGYYFNIGAGRFEGLLLDGSQFISVSRSNSPTFLNGINKWNSSVGAYAFGPYPKFHGFKRYSNGRFLAIDYPGALGTSSAAINDGGTIIGSYFLPSQQDPFYTQHGFIYGNGQWATLDYPDKKLWTSLEGVSNDGTIIGNTIAIKSGIQMIQSAFLYKHGRFETISAPNQPFTQVSGISPNLDLIAGFALDFSGATEGFIATCH